MSPITTFGGKLAFMLTPDKKDLRSAETGKVIVDKAPVNLGDIKLDDPVDRILGSAAQGFDTIVNLGQGRRTPAVVKQLHDGSDLFIAHTGEDRRELLKKS